jgi:hypothetical protein
MPGAATVNVVRLLVIVAEAASIWVKVESNAINLALIPRADKPPTLMDTLDTGSRNLISAGKAGLVPSKFVALQFHAKKFGGLCPPTPKPPHSSRTAPSPRMKKIFVPGFM